MSALGPAASVFYDVINAAASPDQLDNLGRTVWHHWSKGEFSDDEATFLNAAIDKRRAPGRASAVGHLKAVSGLRLATRLGSRFTPRQRPRSLDRQASRDRRRRLGGSSALPDTLRHYYTEGQRAVLCIIAGEIKHHGNCDLPIDKIGALAGVCRTTVQTTLHEAQRLNHIRLTERPRPGQKHLPNVIEITSAEWRIWLKRGPTAHRPIGSKTVNLVSTTKNTDRKERGVSEETRPWRGRGPPFSPRWQRGLQTQNKAADG